MEIQTNKPAARKARIESELSAFAKIPLELTVRSLTEFTLSGEGDVVGILSAVRERFFASAVQDWQASFDPSADLSRAFFTVGGAL